MTDDRESQSTLFSFLLGIALLFNNTSSACGQIFISVSLGEAIFRRRQVIAKNKVEWISAAKAVVLLESSAKLTTFMARKNICVNASEGKVRARALRFVQAQQSFDDFDVPPGFWEAWDKKALTQNWVTGDFETWVEGPYHLKAYGLTFARADIDYLIQKHLETTAASLADARTSRAPRGRPPDWWEDLWVEICRQLYKGILAPKSQADIEHAMNRWIRDNDHAAGCTTVRDRARKLWRMIRRAEN